MTTRTISREETLTVLKHLAGGKAHHVVATITHLNVKAVQDIGEEHGYPHRDKLAAAVEKLQAEIDAAAAPTVHPQAPQIAAQTARTQQAPTRPAVGASTPSTAGPDLRSTTKAGTTEEPFPRVDDEQTARLRSLINTAKGIPTKKVQRQLERALDALTTLQEYVKEDTLRNAEKRRLAEEKSAARAEVERLKAQLAEAQAKLRGPKPTRTPAEAADGGPTSKEIRGWAADNNVACPSRGSVPASVRAAYDAAHTGQDDAA